MKSMVWWLIPIVFLGLNPVPVVTSQSSPDRMLMADMEKVPVLLETDVGRQESTMRGQIVLQRTRDKQGRIVLQLQTLNLLIAGAKTQQGRGETGQISLSLTNPVRAFPRAGQAGETFELELQMSGHYPLINELKGYGRADPKQEDNYPAFTEEFVGRLKGELTLPKGEGEDEGSLTLSGDFVLGQRIVLAVIRRFVFEIPLQIRIFPLTCPDGTVSRTRTLCVKPIFVRSGPGDSTTAQEMYFTEQLANANAVWARCCVRFVEAPGAFVNRADLQVLTTNDGFTSEEEADLLDEVNDDDCVEVYIIESFSPQSAHGGGGTWGGGTADTKIISAANNPPINQRHLAHELGHAMGLCHPGTGCTPPRADGTAGSLMEPSGFFADNPDVLRQQECANISNPLIQLQLLTGCCPHPDA